MRIAIILHISRSVQYPQKVLGSDYIQQSYMRSVFCILVPIKLFVNITGLFIQIVLKNAFKKYFPYIVNSIFKYLFMHLINIY